LQIMSILMKMKMNLYHPFLMASQNIWKCSFFTTYKVVHRPMDITWHLFNLICDYKY
jgi:hypothetical protein